MDGSFYLSKKKEQIILNTSIQNINFNLSILPPDINFEKYFDIGSIKADQLNCLIQFNSQDKIPGLKDIKSRSKDIITGQCKLADLIITTKNNQLLFDSTSIETSFKISENLNQIEIKPFKLSFPDSTVGVSFKDDQTKGKSQLHFTGTSVNVDQARQMSLLLFKNNEITDTIFEIIHKGIVPNVNVSFHGKNLNDLFNNSNFTLQGNIQNGFVNIPGTKLTASRVNGHARIENGVLDIRADKGVIQGSNIKKADLAVDILNYTDFPFHGVFDLDIDLSNIPQTLISLLPDTVLSEELSLVHNVTGRADTKLNLSKEAKSDDIKVKIHTQNFSIAGLYDRIPGQIDLKNINLMYEHDIVHLKNINGVVDSTVIDNLEMLLDTENEPVINITSGSGMLDLDSIMPFLMSFQTIDNFISPVKNAEGKIHITSMALSGPILKLNECKYDIKGTGSNINIFTHLSQQEIENLSSTFHISDDHLDFDKINLTMNSIAWLEAFIAKNHINSIVTPFDMNNGKLQIEQKHVFFNCDLKFNTGPQLNTGPRANIELKGKTLNTLNFNSIQFHDQDLSKGAITFNYNQNKSLFDFNGYLNTKTLNKLIKPGSYLGKKLDTLTQSQPVLITTDKNSNLTVTSKTINLNSFDTGLEKYSSNFDFNLIPDKTIHFKTDELKIKKLNFSNVDTKVIFKKNGHDIKINKAFLCDLETNGIIKLKNEMVQINFPVKAVDKPNIQDLISCLFKNEKFMTGSYSLTCNLLSNTHKKKILKNINGPLEFTAQKGRIYKFTLLSRIFSIINVSTIFKGKLPNVMQQGFGYNKIIIDADIKDSIIYLTKAVIDGKDMTLVFKGWIDPLNDQLDLTCLVAPFKTVDMIVKKVPVINTILGGKLVSIPVKASGKLSDPVIIPLEPSTVGKGLVNMMTNILKTPVTLLDKNDEK